MEFVVGDIVDENTPSDPAGYLHRLKLDRNYRGSGYTVDESLSYDEIARDFLLQRLAMDQKPVVGATVHHAFEDLPAIWPDARFIFIRRDPRDVARSCVQMGWSGTPWHGVEFWLDAEASWQRLCERVPAAQRMALHFEDLVADSPAVLTEVCKLLALEYEPTMLEIDADTTYSRPDPAAARSWRDSASKDEVAQVETRVGLDVLRSLGYEVSGGPVLAANLYNRSRIALLELTARTMAKVQRYGFGLWFCGVLARRLPFHRWREQLQLQVDEIDNQYLK